MSEKNENSLVPIVESLMDKQRKANDTLKAEQVIELNSMKGDLMDEIKKTTRTAVSILWVILLFSFHFHINFLDKKQGANGLV